MRPLSVHLLQLQSHQSMSLLEVIETMQCFRIIPRGLRVVILPSLRELLASFYRFQFRRFCGASILLEAAAISAPTRLEPEPRESIATSGLYVSALFAMGRLLNRNGIGQTFESLETKHGLQPKGAESLGAKAPSD